MINKTKFFFILDLLQITLLLFLIIFSQIFKGNFKKIIELFYILNYIYCICSVYSKEKNLNMYCIFISCNFLFMGSRTILDIFEFRNIATMDKFLIYNLSNNEVIFLLFILLSSQILIQTGYDLGDLFSKKNKYFHEKNIKSLNKITLIGICCLVPFILQKKIIQFMYVRQYGYAHLYLEELKYPLYLTGITTIFNYLYLLFVSTKPKFKNFIKITILYFILMMIDGLGGTRNKLFLFIFFIYTVLLEYNKSLKKIQIIILGIGSIIIAQIIVLFRAKINFDSIELLKHIFIDFINQQGITITVIGAIIHFKETVIQNGKNFILDPLNIFSSRIGNSIERISESKSLAHHISFLLSPERYLNGEGTGGSFLAELLEYNIYIYIILLLCLGIYINLLIKYKNNIYIYIIYIFSMTNLYFMGRGTYFLDWRIIIQILCSFMIVKIYLIITQRKKNE